MSDPDDPIARLNRIQARAKGHAEHRYTWDLRPIPWSAWRSAEVFESMPDEFKNDITIAAGVVRHRQTGARMPLIAANGSGYIDRRVRKAIRAAGQTVAQLDDPNALMDAEERIMVWAKENGFQAEVIGASRPACSRCARLARENGIRLSTPVSQQKRGPAARPGWSPPPPSQGKKPKPPGWT